MKLSGKQYEQLRDAILSAFPRRSNLKSMVRIGIERSLDEITGAEALKDAVEALLDTAEAEGWVVQLVKAARDVNPGNRELFAIAQELGVAPVMPAPPNLERIVERTNTFHDVETWLTRLKQIEARICKIEIRTNGHMGTGFLVGSDLVLTNYHVMESVIEESGAGPGDVALTFSYKRLNDGSTYEGETYRLAPDWLVDATPPTPFERGRTTDYALPELDQLDYALVRVDGAPGGSPRNWIEIPTQPYEFTPGTLLSIVQHPQGQPLKFAIDDDAVLGLNENRTRVRYKTNTDRGSSGSPCFSAEWELVALHHSGDPNFDPAHKPEYNQGIPIDRIAARLEARGLATVLTGSRPAETSRAGGARSTRLRADEPVLPEVFVGPTHKVELKETRLPVEPGGSVTGQATVYNQSDFVDNYDIQLLGLDRSWVVMPPCLEVTQSAASPTASTCTGRLFPDEAKGLTIRFDPPRSPEVKSGDHPFRIAAISTVDATQTATVEGVLAVGPFVDLELTVAGLDHTSRPAIGAVEGAFEVRLTNTGNAHLTVALEAEEAEELDCDFSERQIRVNAGETRTVRLNARPKDLRLGGAALHRFAVKATVIAPAPSPGTATEPTTRRTFVEFRHELPNLEVPVLDPPSLELAGQEAQTTLVLTNRSPVAIAVEVHGSDPANALGFAFDVDLPTTLRAGQVLRVPLRITSVDRTRLAAFAAAIPFTITVTPVQPPGALSSVQGELRRPEPADFRLRLDPERVTLDGERASTDVLLTNRGADPVAVVLEASERSGALRLGFVGGSVHTIHPGGQSVAVQVRITCDDPARLPRPPEATAFTITARSVPPEGEPRSVRGEVVLPAAPDVHLWLEPEEVEGTGAEQAILTVENPSAELTRFLVASQSHDRRLGVSVDPSWVDVAARGRGSVRVRLEPTLNVGPDAAGAPATWGYTVTVTPVDSPAFVKEVSGTYVQRQARIAVRFDREEQDSVGEVTFQVLVANEGHADATVAVEAVGHTGDCDFVLDPSQTTVRAGTRARINLIVTPPSGTAPEARCRFEVLARPISPPGRTVRAEALLICRPLSVELSAPRADRWARQPLPVMLTVRNPTRSTVKARLDAGTPQGKLDLSWPHGQASDEVDVPGNAAVNVPLRAIARVGIRERVPQSLPVSISATPLSPSGGVVTTAGEIALPPWLRWGRRLAVALGITLAIWLVGYLLARAFDNGFIILLAILAGPFAGGWWVRAPLLRAYVLTITFLIVLLIVVILVLLAWIASL